MSTLHEMASEVARHLKDVDFFLVVKPKTPDATGMKRSVVMTNVMRPLKGETLVPGTDVLVLDNTLRGSGDGKAEA